jgi:hypothetical protein
MRLQIGKTSDCSAVPQHLQSQAGGKAKMRRAELKHTNRVEFEEFESSKRN